jgi:hypothetical protein
MQSALFGIVKLHIPHAWSSRIVSSNFEISAAQCSTHYSPDGRVDVLDNVLHQNVRLSEVIFTHNLGSYHLSIMFSIRTLLEWGKLRSSWKTDWELLQSQASEFTPPNMQIHSSNEAHKAAHDFAASIASPYRLPTINLWFYTWNTKYMA